MTKPTSSLNTKTICIGSHQHAVWKKLKNKSKPVQAMLRLAESLDDPNNITQVLLQMEREQKEKGSDNATKE